MKCKNYVNLTLIMTFTRLRSVASFHVICNFKLHWHFLAKIVGYLPSLVSCLAVVRTSGNEESHDFVALGRNRWCPKIFIFHVGIGTIIRKKIGGSSSKSFPSHHFLTILSNEPLLSDSKEHYPQYNTLPSIIVLLVDLSIGKVSGMAIFRAEDNDWCKWGATVVARAAVLMARSTVRCCLMVSFWPIFFWPCC